MNTIFTNNDVMNYVIGALQSPGFPTLASSSHYVMHRWFWRAIILQCPSARNVFFPINRFVKSSQSSKHMVDIRSVRR